MDGVTYASTIGVDTINWMAAIAARLGLKMTSMDICGAFLNGNLDEPEYMESPVEFATILAQMAPKLAKMYPNSSLILMIVKSIYGMVQAAKAWQNTFSKAIKSFRAKNIGMTQLLTDPCVYFWRHDGDLFIIGNHVDDQIQLTNNDSILKAFVKFMPFETQDHQRIDVFLGRKFVQNLNDGIVTVSQRASIKRFIEDEKITKANPIPYPSTAPFVRKTDAEHAPKDELRQKFLSILGKATCLSTGCCPQLVFAVSKFAQLALNPTAEQIVKLKKYLGGYLKHLHDSNDFDGIVFSKKSVYDGDAKNDPALWPNGKIKDGCSVKDFGMEIFVDANHVEKGLPNGKMKSRGGIVVKMVGGPVYCRSKLQGVHAFNTQESEYMELSEACKRAKIYLNLFQEIGMYDPKVDRPTIFEDNTAAGILASSNVLNSKSKHIGLRYAICKELIMEKKVFDLWYLPTQFQLADMNTKAVGEKTFKTLDPLIRGLIHMDTKSKGEPFADYLARIKKKR